MTTEEAIQHFGDRNRMAQALGIWVSATYQWGKHPPEGRQYQIEVLTHGKLKAERDNDARA